MALGLFSEELLVCATSKDCDYLMMIVELLYLVLVSD